MKGIVAVVVMVVASLWFVLTGFSFTLLLALDRQKIRDSDVAWLSAGNALNTLFLTAFLWASRALFGRR